MEPSQSSQSPRLINRELSWLEFNQRVLEEARDPSVLLLERVKFLAIVSSNLDEFFMVRVAGLKRQLAAGETSGGPDGLTPSETLAAVSRRAHELSTAQHRCWIEELQPALEHEGVVIVSPGDATAAEREHLAQYVRRTLLPVLTPLAIDPGHPFPYLANGSLCLVASIRSSTPSPLPPTRLVVVHLPTGVVPRFVPLPPLASDSGTHRFMRLEDVVSLELPWLYHGYDIDSCHAIRVTRDAEITVESVQGEDLLTAVESSLRDRRMGDAVRLQYDADLPQHVLSLLVESLELGGDDLYPGAGFTAFADLFQLYGAVDAPLLKDAPKTPRPVPAFEAAPDVWSAIRAGDVLVQHPYQSFDAVTRFVEEAAVDPKVLAIKMTLYRVNATSPIALALTKAAEHGKEVAVLVELKARFDEAANIRWARALEAVGAHVVYGLPNYKTHCKACLVVRQEADGVRRYCHLGTGNYNAKTAALYTDFGLFTCRQSFGEDLTEVFNLLTGYMRPRPMHHLLMAPTGLRSALVDRIRREADHARAGRAARVVLKLNSLVDPALIEELYAASRAGVDVALIVRGICCLRPSVPGLSERIVARSIVDRYLEHARVYSFDNGGEPEIFLASADWMPRNLDHRIELAFPIVDPALKQVVLEFLCVQLADTVKARQFDADGRSARLVPAGRHPIRAQEKAYELLVLPEVVAREAPVAPEVKPRAAFAHEHSAPRAGHHATP
jgi:polyphosphate kinase